MTPLEAIQRVFDAFANGDARALHELIADDAVWTVNGAVPIAQVYQGRSRIFDMFRETKRQTDGTYRVDLKWALADDAHGIAVYRATGRRLGRELDLEQVLVIEHDNPVWRRITALPTHSATFEAFWT